MDNFKTFDNPADMLLGLDDNKPKPEIITDKKNLKEILDYEKQTKKKLIVIGPKLFEIIEKKAKIDGRSVNNYIVNALKEYVLK